MRSLSLTGAHRHFAPGKEIKGEIKVDWLAPDKFLKSEKSELQPRLTLTLLQAVNGQLVWIDRQLGKFAHHDESEVAVGGGQSTTAVQVTSSTLGMCDTASGTTTIRATPPGAAPSERTLLGMRIPTANTGQERGNSLEKLSEVQRTSKQQFPSTNKPPGLEEREIKAALERQVRKDFLCLALAWLQATPTPLEFTHSGIFNTPQGKIEAIEIADPEGFAVRFFIDQATALPTMISYPELINRQAGYVVSSSTTEAKKLDEVAVQLFFSDYRLVNGIQLPFLIVKAINGVAVDEWKIEKYKLNADLKPKRFEKK